jgi:hypothetical protein
MSSRIWKLALLATILLLLIAWIGGAQDRGPVFSDSDRVLINDYFKHLHASTAPGSIDRSEMPLAVEQSLVAGGRVPLQYQKRLQRVPEALRKDLSLVSGAYEYYVLGRHVLLVRKDTLEITDIVRNAGWAR